MSFIEEGLKFLRCQPNELELAQSGNQVDPDDPFVGPISELLVLGA